MKQMSGANQPSAVPADRSQQIGHMGDLVHRTDGTTSVACGDYPGDARVVEREREGPGDAQQVREPGVDHSGVRHHHGGRPTLVRGDHPFERSVTRAVNAGTST